jgi:energy-coupling factor transport system ATP-binding protein
MVSSAAWPLSLESAVVRYGDVEALHGVTLRIAAGGTVALLGRNGAGKSTLTRLLIGLVRPSSGSVKVGDWDATSRRPDELARRVGYVFQHPEQQLFARTVREDVAFGPRRLGMGDGSVDVVLAELGLADLSGSHPYDLPPARRKLVALAGVLAMGAGALVLDEPTGGLDEDSRSLVVRALVRRAASGVTVLVVSHDLSFVAELAERVVVLAEGRLAADGPARELLRDASTLGRLGLRVPPAAAVALALGLPGAPVRAQECVAALRGARWLAPAVE